jgi:hypothetical protein
MEEEQKVGSVRFRVNNPSVVAETLDEEATIVNLDKGTYYALNGVGSFIWDELSRGASPDEIAAALAARYEVAEPDAGAAVEDLVGELSANELIVPLPGGAEAAPLAANGAHNGNGNGRLAYEPPELSTFTDMQELLLLDPVHEVDASGWPSRA